MNQIQLNARGLLESIEERLTQVEALVSSAHRTISSYEASLYLQEAAELLRWRVSLRKRLAVAPCPYLSS